MACNLLNSVINLDCLDSSGGISKIFIWAGNGVWDTTQQSAGVFTLATGGGSDWYQYEIAKDSAKFSQPATISPTNRTVFYTQELSFVLSKMDVTKRNQLQLLAQNRNTRVIFSDTMGQMWVMGDERGTLISAMAGDSGTALGDANQYSITIQGMEPEMCPLLATGQATSIDAETASIGGYDFNYA